MLWLVVVYNNKTEKLLNDNKQCTKSREKLRLNNYEKIVAFYFDFILLFYLLFLVEY